jgi:hypothetical protein
MMAPHVWHLWPSRQWPASPEEETQFVADLSRAAARVVARRRRPPTEPVDDVTARANTTAVVNALRSGIGAVALLELVPGTPATELLAAYELLSDGLRASAQDWAAIVTEPALAGVLVVATSASVLMAVPMHRIATISANGRGCTLTTAVVAISASVGEHTRRAEAVERALAQCPPQDLRRRIALGAQLHNPLDPALWGSPYYLPSRVTTLSPRRVADLLGERDPQ